MSGGQGPLRFIRADQSVTVPPSLAGPLLDVLRPVVGASGRRLPHELLELLNALALVDVSRTRNPGAPAGSLEEEQPSWCSTRDAARTCGLWVRRVQQLAAAGTIRSRRVGTRVLEVDARDLHDHLRRHA